MTDYSAVFATVGLGDLEDSAIRLSLTLEADGATAQASLVRQAFITLLEELKVIARDTALDARKKIREEQVATKVRPDAGPPGGPSLDDYIGESHALTGVEGSVGVNDEDALANSPVFWWLQHEEGSDIHVGQRLKGFFNPGKAAPNKAEFRSHPLFTPARGGKLGTVEEPIPARHFVETGAKLAEADWHAAIRAAKSKFTTTCARAVASAPPPRLPAAKRGPAKRRRP